MKDSTLFEDICIALFRAFVLSYFDSHNYSQNCQFWDKLNEAAHHVYDLNPYNQRFECHFPCIYNVENSCINLDFHSGLHKCFRDDD